MTRSATVDTDTTPVSEFGANAAELIEQINHSGRALVLTDHGQSAAVVLGVAEYERMVETIELLSDVRTSLMQAEAGDVVSSREARR